jgi:hypothetical protein
MDHLQISKAKAVTPSEERNAAVQFTVYPSGQHSSPAGTVYNNNPTM